MGKIATSLADPTLKGWRYSQSYKAAVVAILGKGAPKVSSKGRMFYHKARWTARVAVHGLCEWAKTHPNQVITRQEITDIVRVANNERCLDPEIVIATTPEKLPIRIAMALLGGAYHESFHGWASCQRDLKVREFAKLVIPRWALVPD